MESSSQISQRLFLRTTHGIKLGLDRMREASQRIGNPQNQYPCFHVAGTNGKGSVCAYLESCLRRMGFKTGLFTSPHIVDFEERFIVNGEPVESGAWIAVYREFEPVIDRFELTFFEAATLIAFELFKRENVQWAVFETGMGGRLDATNIVVPRVSVVTRIAMDHMQFLGDTLKSIAREKLGIVKPGVPLVIAEPDEPGIRDLALEWCRCNKAACRFVSRRSAREIERTGNRFSFTYNNLRYSPPLAGDYQIANSLTAIEALAAAGFANAPAIAEGIGAAYMPGRFQISNVKGKTVVFDVGHNPDAAAVFAETVLNLFPGKSVCVVAGIMKDKDTAGILSCYCRAASKIVLAKPEGERSADTAALRMGIPDSFAGNVLQIPSVAEAVAAALDSGLDIVCVAGSFFTVGEAMKALGVRPYGGRTESA